MPTTLLLFAGTHHVVKDVWSTDITAGWSQLTVREYATGKLLAGHRQKLYVLSRVAAKQAIREYVSWSSGLNIQSKAIEIFATPKQGPSFRFVGIDSNSEERLPTIDISLAHCGEVAVAGLGDKRLFSSIGIDVEKNRTFKSETIAGFLSPTEKEQYQNIIDEKCQQRFLMRQWCIKEAYMKAKKLGLRLHPQRIGVAESGQNQYVITEDGKQVSATVHYGGLNDEYGMAIVALNPINI